MNYVLWSTSWKKKKQKKTPWGVTNTSKKAVGFERGRCLLHLPPALRKPSQQKNEWWTGCLRSHSPMTMPTGLPATEPQADKMLQQDLCLNLRLPTNPSPLTESSLRKGGDLCSHRAHYTIPANTWLTYEEKSMPREEVPRIETKLLS